MGRLPLVGQFASALLLVACSARASAQSIHGHVLDNETRMPIPYATVRWLTPESTALASVLTDSVGSFTVNGRAGSARLRVEALGYAPALTESLTVSESEHVEVEVRLSPRAVPLEPLRVVARSGWEKGRYAFERRAQIGRGVFLTRDSIRLREPGVASDAFHGVPGIALMPQPSCERGAMLACKPVISSITGAQCLAIFVDHIDIPFSWDWLGKGLYRPAFHLDRRSGVIGDRDLAGGGAGIDVFVDPDRIEGIEIYRDISEVPQELRTAARMAFLWPVRAREPCGMAIIWTREGW